MAFALATGHHITRLATSTVVETHGYGKTHRVQGHPGWLIVSDEMTPIGRAPDPRSPWQVVCDGYLANTAELVASLPDARSLRGQPTATIVAALLDHGGPEALFRLVGNFALAAANEQDGSVVAMRDRMGGRTLYRLDDGSANLLLASRSAWVQMLSARPFTPDPKFLASFFALQPAPPPGHSAFEGVREFLPGEQLRLQQGRVETLRPPLNLEPDFDYSHPGDCIARFRELFEQAVAATLPPTGDVACMLSGGLDSGPMAIVADRLLMTGDSRLHVASWHLDRHPAADERKWIELIGKNLASPLFLLNGNEPLPFDRLSNEVIGLDLPYYNAFRVQVNACYRYAAELSCRIILNGNAGDELYPSARLLGIDRLKRRQWTPLWRDLTWLWRANGIAGVLKSPMFKPPRSSMAGRGKAIKQRAPKWLTNDARKHWQPMGIWPPELSQANYPGYANQLLGYRMAFGRAHEAEFPARFGVERRDPFQNEALARFMLHAPIGLSHRRGQNKWVMRMASKGWLPDPVRKKARTGRLDSFFAVGLNKNQETVRKLAANRRSACSKWLSPRALSDLAADETRHNQLIAAYCAGFCLWEQTWSTWTDQANLNLRHD